MKLGRVLLKLLSLQVAKLLNYLNQSWVIQSISLPPKQMAIFLLYKGLEKTKSAILFFSPKSHAQSLEVLF